MLVKRSYKKDTSLKKRVSLSLVLAALLVIVLSSIGNVQVRRVENGDRIKVLTRSFSREPIVGWIRNNASTDLVLSTSDSVLTIPVSSIERIYISTGTKRNTLPGMLIGAVGGGLILGFATMASNPPPDTCEEGEFLCGAFEISDGQAFGIGAAVGVLGGGLLGAIIGSTSSTDRWEQVPMKVSVDLTSHYAEDATFYPSLSIRLSL